MFLFARRHQQRGADLHDDLRVLSDCPEGSIFGFVDLAPWKGRARCVRTPPYLVAEGRILYTGGCATGLRAVGPMAATIVARSTDSSVDIVASLTDSPADSPADSLNKNKYYCHFLFVFTFRQTGGLLIVYCSCVTSHCFLSSCI